MSNSVALPSTSPDPARSSSSVLPKLAGSLRPSAAFPTSLFCQQQRRQSGPLSNQRFTYLLQRRKFLDIDLVSFVVFLRAISGYPFQIRALQLFVLLRLNWRSVVQLLVVRVVVFGFWKTLDSTISVILDRAECLAEYGPLQLTTMFKRVYYGKKNDTLPGASVVVVVVSDGLNISHSPLFILWNKESCWRDSISGASPMDCLPSWSNTRSSFCKRKNPYVIQLSQTPTITYQASLETLPVTFL